jgi:hypothetical protein
MAEINDRDLGMFELVPRGSLLYWIDNFLAEPEYSGNARRVGRPTDTASGRYAGVVPVTGSSEDLRLWGESPDSFCRCCEGRAG